MDNDGSQWPCYPDEAHNPVGGRDPLPRQGSSRRSPQAAIRKSARWNPTEHKVFIETCELVIAEGHRRGKCFSPNGWARIAELFNAGTGKTWTTTQMKNYWNKLRTEHKHVFELLRCTGIEYRPGSGRIHAPEHWWEAKIKENPKYAKYKNFDCSEIYDTYGKLFGDTGDATKYALSPTKLSQRGLDLSTDSDREYRADAVPINAEGTDSSASPNEGRTSSHMNISGGRSGEKRKCKYRKQRRKKKSYGAREVSASLEQMVSVGTDLASIARSYQKDVMSSATVSRNYCLPGMYKKVMRSTFSHYGSYGIKTIENRTPLPRHRTCALSSLSTASRGISGLYRLTCEHIPDPL